jgi:hypothetical protein
MYKVYLPLFLYLLAVLPLCAQQPTQPNRIELDYKQYDIDAEVIALPDSGLLLLTKTAGSWSTPPLFELTKYNTQLQVIWRTQLAVNTLSEFLAHHTEPPYTYLAFSDDSQHGFHFIKLHMRTGATQTQLYNIEQIDSIYTFKTVQGNYFMIARNQRTSKPMMVYLDTKTSIATPLPSVYGAESSFSDLLAHPQHNQLSLVMSESNGRISRIQTKLFNADGKLLGNYFINPIHDKNYLNAEITPGDSSSRLLLGTYSQRNLRFANGFFTGSVAGAGTDMRFYSFLELKNIFKYMKPRREERVRRREAKRLLAGKEPGLRYKLLLHDACPTNNGYILTGEVYTSENNFRNNRFTGITGYFGRQQNTYRHTLALALSFDKNGVLLWDNSFKLANLETYDIEPAVEVVYSPDGRVVIAYPYKSEIHYKVIDEDKYTPEKSSLDIKAQNEEDKVLSTSVSGIISWYGLNFAAFGWHRVKPVNSEVKTVFYINRLSFE